MPIGRDYWPHCARQLELSVACHVCSEFAKFNGDCSATFRSVVRGFHVYQAVWSPVVHEELSTQQEHGNPED